MPVSGGHRPPRVVIQFTLPRRVRGWTEETPARIGTSRDPGNAAQAVVMEMVRARAESPGNPRGLPDADARRRRRCSLFLPLSPSTRDCRPIQDVLPEVMPVFRELSISLSNINDFRGFCKRPAGP